MRRLRIGVIGCGSIARSVHIPILASLPEVELVGLAEPDPSRREQAARLAPQASRWADYRELLREPLLDAVVISVPNSFHAEIAIAAFRRHKHVYLEKPLATCLADARDLLEAWQEAGVTGMIGFNYRFNPLFQAVRRQIAAGRLGQLVCARSVFATSASDLPSWKRARATGGGVLLDLASHHIDLIRYFFGQEISAVSAELRSQRSEGDSAVLHLRLADGLPVQSFFSLSAVEEDRFALYGSAGKLTVDRYLSLDVEFSEAVRKAVRLKRWARSARSIVQLPYLFRKLREPGGEPSYRAALAHFVAAALSGSSMPPDLLDGYRSLAVIEAAEQSAALGRMVPVPPMARDGAAEPILAAADEPHHAR